MTCSADSVSGRGSWRRGRRANTSALRAWWRCQPVMAHSSSRILPSSALLARRYCVPMVWVTARHWPIVSPMLGTNRSRTSWPLGAPYMHLPASQRSAAILVSQRAAAERYGLHAHAASDGGTGDFNNNLTHRTPECPGDLSQLALAGRVNLFIGGGIERGHKPVHQTVRRRPRAYRSARSLGEAGDDCGVRECHSPDALDQ